MLLIIAIQRKKTQKKNKLSSNNNLKLTFKKLQFLPGKFL